MNRLVEFLKSEKLPVNLHQWGNSSIHRAKIFSPFAALRGYEEEIQSEGRDHLKGSRVELSEGEQEKLSEQLQKVTKGMRVAIRYGKVKIQLTFTSHSVKPLSFFLLL